MPLLSPITPWVSWIAFAAVVVIAARRSRTFGVFAGVVLGVPTYVALAMAPTIPVVAPLFGIVHLLACLHFAALVLRPAMRPRWFRVAISIPGLWFVASSLLALPWAVAASLGFDPWVPWLPFALAGFGVVQSSFTREETVSIRLDGAEVEGVRRYAQGYGTGSGRPLKIVQITDPHLGPFMSVERLRAICRRAVEREPDLILITGDLMTMESHDVGVVSEALAPLAAMRGRVFACHGNHDHEARDVVARACARHGIELLVDAAATVDTAGGRVQLVGLDFVWRGRDVHVPTTLAEHPREPGATRIVLLHDPGAFKHVPAGDADLVLSGHTHGGQVGLLSLGSRSTILSLFGSMPDHGLWAGGRNRLYVHRAQGHYGYPVRLGVPAEQSLLQVFGTGT